MSIASTDLLLYGSANLPSDDVSTTGGAIDATMRPEYTELTANSVIAIVSDGADTRQVTITGRLATGAVDTETLTLNGTTEVVGAKTFERIQKVVAASTSGTRTVTVKQGSGGATKGTIPPNEKGFYRQFNNSASATGAVTRYEKSFWKNAHGSLTLTQAQVTLTTDGSNRIRIGLAPSNDDSATITNRKTTPSSVTFVDDNVAQDVPGTTLAAGSAVGMWVEEALLSNDGAFRSSYTTQLSGSTT